VRPDQQAWLMGSVRNRQTKFRMKSSTGPMRTANTDVVAEVPVRSRCSMVGSEDCTVR
jgi:hypothetical protein